MLKNIKDVLAFCEENEVKMIDFKMVDIDGRWRHITIPVSRFNEDTLKYGIGFDGSNYGYAPVENSDMVFIPLIESAVLDPYADIPTLSMTGDVCVIGKDNLRFDQYPRSVALAAEEYMRKTGIADKMIIGPEFEFHLFDQVSYETSPNRVAYHLDTEEGDWNSKDDEFHNLGYQVHHKGGYHISAPQDASYDLRSRMCMVMEDWGVKVKYHHHEVGGPCQLEIEVELAEMSKMADDTMAIKYIIKNQAVAEGKSATFMPKPLYGEAGNGMHVHMLLFKDGKPLFYDEKGYSSLSKTALYFIGGLLKHASSLCGFTNPSTNSYKRLVPGFEAPATVGFATANRSAVIRIPAYAKSPDKKRFELRNPDATCNPYYAYSAILMAGLDGIKNKIDPADHNWGPFDFNLFDLSPEELKKVEHLPTSLDQALDALENDHDYLTEGGVFPPALINAWIARKRKQAQEIGKIPHPAEFKEYYDL